MLGAIIGDIAGSTKRTGMEELLGQKCHITGNSVMMLAAGKEVAESFIRSKPIGGPGIADRMTVLGKAYAKAGYNDTIVKWIFGRKVSFDHNQDIYAVVSTVSIGTYVKDKEEITDSVQTITDIIQYNNEACVKGAEAINAVIYMAKNGKTIGEIRKTVKKKYYPLDFTIKKIRSTFKYDESSSTNVPVAIEAFLESNSFENAIERAISAGGNTAAIASLTGAMAEAYYGVPVYLVSEVLKYLDAPLLKILYEFEEVFPTKLADTGAVKTVFEAMESMIPMQVNDLGEETKDFGFYKKVLKQFGKRERQKRIAVRYILLMGVAVILAFAFRRFMG